ncbi:ABC transporter permease subunit [Thermobifida halotolerans]|uniref:ABC transporter permease subunit n=1 Tax=Thermobifida halotolerans TaxID=483545 RepID=A0AA97LZC0_9ACTN|nr:ABC transporter permease subunit [Thermobifida halotolerans]UOE20625.1 ABC transporter permease subunit [Thermobifida halotolerans]
MIPALNSELLLLRHRGAPYAVGAAWVAMVVSFAFLVPYIVYANLDAGQDRDQILLALLPEAVASTSVSSYPLFGGAMMLILGVLLTGSEYRWNTWTARLSQGPDRIQVVAAKFTAGVIAAALVAAAALLAAVAASVAVALVTDRPVRWPGAVDLLASLGGAALISVAWMSVGAALAVAFRGTSVALAVGLLWTLGLESAVSGLASMFGPLEPVRSVLLGTASGSLVAALGAPTLEEGGTPGVVDHLDAPAAVAVLLAYTALSVAVAAWLIRRRDIS